MPSASTLAKESKKKYHLSSSTDPLFGGLRDLNFSQVGKTLNKHARRLDEDYKVSRSIDEAIALSHSSLEPKKCEVCCSAPRVCREDRRASKRASKPSHTYAGFFSLQESIDCLTRKIQTLGYRKCSSRLQGPTNSTRLWKYSKVSAKYIVWRSILTSLCLRRLVIVIRGVKSSLCYRGPHRARRKPADHHSTALSSDHRQRWHQDQNIRGHQTRNSAGTVGFSFPPVPPFIRLSFACF